MPPLVSRALRLVGNSLAALIAVVGWGGLSLAVLLFAVQCAWWATDIHPTAGVVVIILEIWLAWDFGREWIRDLRDWWTKRQARQAPPRSRQQPERPAP